jgi:hypothetical protein
MTWVEAILTIVVRAIVILYVSSQSSVADGSSLVGDLILGVDEITSWKTRVFSQVFGILGCLTLGSRALDRLTTRSTQVQ